MKKNLFPAWLWLSVFLPCFLNSLTALAVQGTPKDTTKIRFVESYGNLPLSFEPNQGRTDKQVKFLSRGLGYGLFLTPTEAVLSLHKPKAAAPETRKSPDHANLRSPSGKTLNKSGQIDKAIATTLRTQLVGGNPNSQIKGLDGLPGKVNYFRGNDPKQWITNIPTYAKVKYEAVYPGIDLIYYGNQRQLEYDFIVAPGADPKAVRLAFEGADKLKIDKQGDLVLKSKGDDVRLRKPRVYQDINGQQREIEGHYALYPAKNHSKGKVGFQVAAYDKSKPLVIDPVLVYSTYLGGSGYDYANGIAVDSTGNAYVVGTTYSTDFPTQSPLQANNNGGPSDVFITKINAAGSGLVYSTYLGGSGEENPWDLAARIAVDSSGNAYVVGTTYSTDFPTQGPLQANNHGNGDVFVTKINAAGNALVYSTYLGGSGANWATGVPGDHAYGIALDSAGNAYVTGYTFSTDFPTQGPLQLFNQARSGSFSDVFITKINAAGSALVYSTYLGGSSFDVAYGIAVDSAGNAYVAGQTNFDATDFPTKNPLQASQQGGNDVFITKINAAGSALVYSTYLGGSNWDIAFDIAVDNADNAYVVGETNSTNFPTQGPLQANINGGGDAFVTKINAAGSALVYSTYLGGSHFATDSGDRANGIAVDSAGNAYVVGLTCSTDFPTQNPLQVNNNGCYDAFVSKINTAGSGLVYSTYLGGSYSDDGLGIAVDGGGSAYITGYTQSSDFPTHANNPSIVSYDPVFNGGAYDAFVAKISDATDLSPKIIGLSSSSGPEGATITIGGSNFGSTQNSSSVNVCGVDALAGHWEDALIAIAVPSLPAGTKCSVFVTTPAGSSNSVDFMIIAPGNISGFLKTGTGKGIYNAQVVVAAGASGVVKSDRTGLYSKSGLANGQYTVKPVKSGFLFTPETQIIDINGANRNAVNFTGSAVVPIISSIQPNTGGNGAQVTISGSGFGSFDTDINRVKFGSAEAAIQSWDNKKIVVLAPPGSGSVLVTVATASGTSNGEPFSYQSPLRRNVSLVPSGDFGVLIFNNLDTVSSDTSNVVEDITIENVSGAWYVVHIGVVGSVTGNNLPTSDFLIGPFETIALGQVTFSKKSQLSFLADNSIDTGTCNPICDLQTRRILGALAGDMFWRIATGGPYPADELDKIMFLVDTEVNNPLITLGIDIWQALNGDYGAALSIANDVGDVFDDPVTGPLFTSLLEAHGFTSELPLWITIYSRAGQVIKLLIETLIYPNVGQLTFNAR